MTTDQDLEDIRTAARQLAHTAPDLARLLVQVADAANATTTTLVSLNELLRWSPVVVTATKISREQVPS